MDKSLLTSIKYFTGEEIRATGGTIAGVSYQLFQRLDSLREMLGVPLNLLKGGLNSGKHLGNKDVHFQGIAADFIVSTKDPTIVFRAMMDCRFSGIGIYWNGVIYSYHADIREAKRTALWMAVKDRRAWKYLPFEIKKLA